MDSKPYTLTMKQWLVKKLSVDLQISEKVINDVVNHQFEQASAAMKIYNSVEFSGFGKLIFYIKGAKNKLKKLKDKLEAFEEIKRTGENKKKSLDYMIEDAKRGISIIETKLQNEN